MNRKILTTLIDILLIVAVIFLTETLTLRVIRTTSTWAYIGIYILLYATLFGAKWPSGIRTPDTLLKRQVLYRLS